MPDFHDVKPVDISILLWITTQNLENWRTLNKPSSLFSSGSLCDETLERTETFRFVNPVRYDYRYRLGYAGKQKVGM